MTTNFLKAKIMALITDWLLELGIIGIKQWQPTFVQIEDLVMQRYVNLTDIMHTCAKNRHSYLKTGKAVVATGKTQTLPTMKGTRSRS